jgi:hypothetical protein
MGPSMIWSDIKGRLNVSPVVLIPNGGSTNAPHSDLLSARGRWLCTPGGDRESVFAGKR